MVIVIPSIRQSHQPLYIMKKLILSALSISLLTVTASQAATVFQLGAPGRGWPAGTGGGPDVTFVQESNSANALPGDPNSPAVNQQADDDYYFAGTYPAPISTVANDEIAAERAFTGGDITMRIHHNMDSVLPTDRLTISWENNSLDQRTENSDPRYGIEILVNGFQVMPEMIIRPGDLNTVQMTAAFTASDVGIMAGSGFDNIVELRGTNYSASGGGNWMGVDYVKLETVPDSASTFALFSLSLAGIGYMRSRRKR